MELPQHVWDTVLSYVGFLLDATIRLHKDYVMYDIVTAISCYGEISVGSKNLLKIVKFMKVNYNADLNELSPKVGTRFFKKYNRQIET